jgi:hypothetical protein
MLFDDNGRTKTYQEENIAVKAHAIKNCSCLTCVNYSDKTVQSRQSTDVHIYTCSTYKTCSLRYEYLNHLPRSKT